MDNNHIFELTTFILFLLSWLIVPRIRVSITAHRTKKIESQQAKKNLIIHLEELKEDFFSGRNIRKLFEVTLDRTKNLVYNCSVHFTEEETVRFSQAWKKYKQTEPAKLKKKQEFQPDGSHIFEYSEARKLLSEPLDEMLEFLK